MALSTMALLIRMSLTMGWSHRHYYGRTEDGEDFYIQQQGVGYNTREQTWLVRYLTLDCVP